MEIPSNIRAYVKQFYDTTPLTEQYLNSQDIQALRRAYYNQEDMRNYVGDDSFRASYIDPQSIRYNNYRRKNNRPDSFEDSVIGNVVNSLFDADYRMGSLVGSANYHADKNGNVIITDRYDFNKGIDLQNANPLYKALHWAGTNLGKPYDVNINLGNPKNWYNEWQED